MASPKAVFEFSISAWGLLIMSGTLAVLTLSIALVSEGVRRRLIDGQVKSKAAAAK